MRRINHQGKLLCRLALLAVLGALATLANAQQQSAGTVKVLHLKGNFYWSQTGPGVGNTGIIIGQNGVIVIDTAGNPDNAKEMLAQIAKITPKPVTHVLFTHSDSDHVGGIAAFPKGVNVITQENQKADLETAVDNARQPYPREFLPTHTFAAKEALTIDGVHVVLLHWAPAHTSGDLVAYFPEQKVVYAGDLLTRWRLEPAIHNAPGSNQGSVAGWMETEKGLIGLNADTYVPGHGELETKADVRYKLMVMQDKWNKIKDMVARGKSLDDIKTEFAEPKAPTGPAWPSDTVMIYNEITKKS